MMWCICFVVTFKHILREGCASSTYAIQHVLCRQLIYEFFGWQLARGIAFETSIGWNLFLLAPVVFALVQYAYYKKEILKLFAHTVLLNLDSL